MDTVGLPQRLAARLARGRAAAQARMGAANGASDCVVRRRTGHTVQDADGREVAAWADVHVDLPIRIDSGSSSDGGSRNITLDGVEYEQATALAHIPALTADLADGDYIEVTAGGCVGDVYRIVAAGRADQKTARRLPIEEKPRPSEWGA